jgi:hypothetical protein
MAWRKKKFSAGLYAQRDAFALVMQHCRAEWRGGDPQAARQNAPLFVIYTAKKLC